MTITASPRERSVSALAAPTAKADIIAATDVLNTQLNHDVALIDTATGAHPAVGADSRRRRAASRSIHSPASFRFAASCVLELMPSFW